MHTLGSHPSVQGETRDLTPRGPRPRPGIGQGPPSHSALFALSPSSVGSLLTSLLPDEETRAPSPEGACPKAQLSKGSSGVQVQEARLLPPTPSGKLCPRQGTKGALLRKAYTGTFNPQVRKKREQNTTTLSQEEKSSWWGFEGWIGVGVGQKWKTGETLSRTDVG